MADYTFSDDFEDGDLAGWSNLSAAVTNTTAAAHTGTRGMRQVANGAQAVASLSDSTLPNGYPYARVDFWVRQVSHGSGNSSIITVQNRTGSDHFDVFVNYDADSRFWWDLLSSNTAQSPSAVVLGQWYRFIVVVFFGGTTWTARVWIDDVERPSIATVGKTSSDVRTIHVGGFGTDVNTRDYDDIAVTLSMTDPSPTAQVAALGSASETATAQPIGRRKTLALPTATEMATARPLGMLKPLTPAGETDEAQPLARAKRATLDAAQETTEALPVGRRKTLPVGTAETIDAPQPIGRAKTLTVGHAVESDTAQTISMTGMGSAPVDPAHTVEQAQPIGRRKRLAVAPAVEQATAPDLGRARALRLGAPAETATVLALGRAKTRAVGTAYETTLAVPLGGAEVPEELPDLLGAITPTGRLTGSLNATGDRSGTLTATGTLTGSIT